jgi:hypothetical protein
MSDETQPQVEMPRYRCHKEVHALKIADITPNPNPRGLDFPLTLHFEEKRFAPIKIDRELSRKHPQIGGYYVVYADGYASFSPAKAFEDGYTRI